MEVGEVPNWLKIVYATNPLKLITDCNVLIMLIVGCQSIGDFGILIGSSSKGY